MIGSVFSCCFPSLSSEVDTFSTESVQNSSHLDEYLRVSLEKTPDAGRRGRAFSSGAMLPALNAAIWSGRTKASSFSIFFSSFSQQLSRSEKGVLATAPKASSVLAPMMMTKRAVPHLGEGSSIVFIGSTTGSVGFPGCSAYTATKGAVAAVTRALAVELAPKGIRVNIVAPGYVRTPMLQPHLDANAGYEDWIVANTPLGRIDSPEDLAPTIVFLLSPLSVKEMPHLVRTYRKFSPRGYEMIAVAVSRDQPERVAAVAAKLPFKVAFDKDGAVAQGFGGLVGHPEPLGPIVVWNRLRGSGVTVPVRGCASAYDVLLAAGRVAYRCDNSGEGYTVHDSLRLGTAELVRTHGEEFSGSFLGGLVADRGTIAFDVGYAAGTWGTFRIRQTRLWKSSGARSKLVRTFRGDKHGFVAILP